MTRQFCAGGVVYKKIGKQILFLIRRSSPPYDEWNLPKGWLDDADEGIPGPKTTGEVRASVADMEEAALREVREEGGVEAKIISRLGYEKYVFTDEQKQRHFKIVTFFLMEYLRDIPAGFGYETAEIKWVDLPDSLMLLKKRPRQADLVAAAAKLL
jgi:8-oxo-dGTP pyrophosphatase MutT (NUDIX family)